MNAALLLNSVVSGVIAGLNYALFAVGLSFIFGVLKVINLSHGELVLLGGYIGYFSVKAAGLPFPLAVLLAAAVTSSLGVIYYYVLKRVRADELNTLILTYGVGVVLTNLFLLAWTADERIINISWMTEGVRLGVLEVNRGNLVSAFFGLVLITLLSAFLHRTKLGKMIRATSMDREAASLVGIDVGRVDAVAFVIGCALAGVAGPLFGVVSHINPVSGEVITINAFILTVLAGLGSIPGLLLAGIILGVGESVIVVLASSMFQGIFALAIFIVVLFFRPEGIFGRSG